MKLLFVHQHLGAFGGAEANILLTARELQRRGHELGLLYRSGTGRNEEAWRAVFTNTFPLSAHDATRTLESTLAEFAPDAIYLHKLADLKVLEALVHCGRPTVRMVHDHDMYCMRSYKYNYFTRRICTRPTSAYCLFPCLAFAGRNRQGHFPLQWVSYRAKRKELRLNRQFGHCLVYSNYARNELLRNGFDAEKISLYTPIQCWGTDGPVSSLDEQNLVLYAGQIIRGKGVDVLLEALTKVRVDFKCVILGEGNDRPRCEQLCTRLGLQDRVQFRGFVLPDALREFYLQASVFVVSSVWPEPFGLTGPEAMRYGLPVVAFDAGGISEWLSHGQNGYLVPWIDTTRYAQCIEKLLRNKELARQMGRRGRELVNEKYNATGQVDDLEKIFLRLLRSNDAVRPYTSRAVPAEHLAVVGC